MKLLPILILFLFSVNLKAQFLHPNVGINSEFVGACLTSTCGGVYTDNGGGGAYPNNSNNFYRVFCPSTANNCISLTFTQFDVQGNATCSADWLTVGNGPTQNSPVFTTPPALASGRICGTPALPFTYTAANPSGCLTVRFRSDLFTNRPGWSANISCVPCGTNAPAGTNADCAFATPLCSSASLSDASIGPGIVAEGCNGSNCPAGGENFSNWYAVNFATSGTFMFTIAPLAGAVDYDFAVYGPNNPCSALGIPIRCNDSGNTGNTGLSAAGVNPTEIVTGPTFCTPMNVIAGQTYYIVIDSWSPPISPVGYNLSFGGTATFNCSILPVEMTKFVANYNSKDKSTELNWETVLENNVDYFAIERGIDANIFTEIASVKPYEGDSKIKRTYYFSDKLPMSNEINYYRIVTVDKNGRKSLSNIQAVAFQDEDANLMLVPNPANSQVELRFKSTKDKNWGINFFDNKGNNLKTINYTAGMDGTNIFTMNIEDLKSGMYFISITDGVNIYKRKLIKE
jgi:hypothetical protein